MFTLHNFPRQQFERKCREAGKGAEFQGEIVQDGVTIGYAYNPFNQTLRVEILGKPWLYPQATVEQKIREWLTS